MQQVDLYDRERETDSNINFKLLIFLRSWYIGYSIAYDGISS